MAPPKARGGGYASLMAGAVAIAVAVLASVAVLSKYSPYTSKDDFRTLLWQIDESSPAQGKAPAFPTSELSSAGSATRRTALSKAHSQMLKVAAPHRQSLFEMLGCECQDISKIWMGANQWGNYAPKCCNRDGGKHSVSHILDEELKSGTSDLQKIREALKKAKSNLHQKLSVIVDAVTLKDAGRPGPPGPQGRKGPQGYTGPPGVQGPRGPPGIIGKEGPQGHPGLRGYRGETGERGPKGPDGYVGVPGPPGYIGPNGPRGDTGDMGAPGIKGPVGPPGNMGVAGRPGEAGRTGKPGPKGRVTTIWGYAQKTPCNLVRGQSIVYLDRHTMQCNRWGNEFMERFQLIQGKCPGSDMQYDYLCVSPAQWETCSSQGGVCKCNGVVRYGSDPYWSRGKKINGEIACNDQTFGDPYYGKQKRCECASEQYSGVSDCVEGLLTPCQDFGNVVAYIDRQSLSCPADKLLTGMKMERWGCKGNEARYKYSCCKPTKGIRECRDAYTQCDYMGGRPVEFLDRHNVACNAPNEALQGWSVGNYWCGPYGNDRMRYKYRCCTLNN